MPSSDTIRTPDPLTVRYLELIRQHGGNQAAAARYARVSEGAMSRYLSAGPNNCIPEPEVARRISALVVLLEQEGDK
jgi:hypothetical protein